MSCIRFIILGLACLIIGLQKSNAQNIDSLLGIWDNPNNKVSIKLEAIQQLLSAQSYYISNLDTAAVLAMAQYNLAKENKPKYLIDALINRENIAYEEEQYLEVINLADECLRIDSPYLTATKKGQIIVMKARSLSHLIRFNEALN